jgi:hypothetical protein
MEKKESPYAAYPPHQVPARRGRDDDPAGCRTAPRHRTCRSAPQVSLLACGNEEGSFVKSSVASSCCSTSPCPRLLARVARATPVPAMPISLSNPNTFPCTPLVPFCSSKKTVIPLTDTLSGRPSIRDGVVLKMSNIDGVSSLQPHCKIDQSRKEEETSVLPPSRIEHARVRCTARSACVCACSRFSAAWWQVTESRRHQWFPIFTRCK